MLHRENKVQKEEANTQLALSGKLPYLHVV